MAASAVSTNVEDVKYAVTPAVLSPLNEVKSIATRILLPKMFFICCIYDSVFKN